VRRSWVQATGTLASATTPAMPRTKVVRAVALAMTTIAVGAMIAACGGSTSPGASSATTSPSSSLPYVHGAAKLSPGCDPAPAVQAPGTSITLQPVIAGLTRTVIVHEPTGYNAGTATPLVLNLHGSQSTAAAQEAFTGMDATADTDHFFVVYPQGDIPAASGFEWNVPNEPLFGGAPVPASAPNDISFLEQLVSLLEQRYCIDENRVYATGFSGGARMASQLGCNASQTFAAVAPVSGLRLPSPCPATRAVPVLSFHGTADPVDPYSGNGQAYWTYSVPTAAARWGVQDGCSPTAGTLNPSKTVVVTTYSHCSDGAIVELYTIVGEGHEWPGGPKLPRSTTRVLGPQSTAVSANATMWSFFVAHPLVS
jgi:polyhydroxybutyrate depolymerase